MRSLWFLMASVLLVGMDLAAQQARPWNHFKPRDHSLGDVHPFIKDGECWLYYLKPGKYESALVRSRDWLHWEETPITHDPALPEDWMSPYFVLGVLHDPVAKVYRSFYGHKQGRIASSVSKDLLHWSCAPKTLSVPPGDYYQRRRDPFVFWIAEEKQFGCVMTTQLQGRPKEQAGAVSFATSPDLEHWQDHGPILDPGNIGEPECPQMFSLGAHWYLLASIYDRAVGQPVYWMADHPKGPWRKEPSGVLDGKDLCAAQVAFDGDVPVLFGWIPLQPSRPGKQIWGGHLALPREVYALADGTLGTRMPTRVARAFDKLPWQTEADFEVHTEPHVIEGEWKDLAADFTLRMTDTAKEVRVRFSPLGEVVISQAKLRILDAKGESWSESPVSLPASEPIRVRLMVEGSIVELFVNDRYSLCARLPVSDEARRLSFSGDSGAAVSAMRCSRLLEK